MNFYFAPMEGLTRYIYRNAHHKYFSSINKYFSPFIVANQSNTFKSRDINDVLPENNSGIKLIPQILTNQAADFIHTARKITELGYEEINLNLGCPSGTVVSKNRGSGFLSKKKELDEFLDQIYTECNVSISVKTRLGKEDPEEFYELITIFNKYPMKELIIHPRIQKDFYKNTPNLAIFKDALKLSKNSVCYNGDIFSVKDYIEFTSSYPEVNTCMLGRGLLANPGLIQLITENKKLDKKILREFHDTIYEDYKRLLSGDRNVLFKMKELWFYMICMFSDPEKHAKKIKKSERFYEYEEAVASLFREKDLLEFGGFQRKI